MIKTIMCIKRKPGLTREAFEHHWRHLHAALISSLREELRIVKYVQSNADEEVISTIMRQQRGGPEKFDGLGQATFRSMEDLMAVSQSSSGRAALAALRADEEHFIDLANSPMFIVNEHVIFRD